MCSEIHITIHTLGEAVPNTLRRKQEEALTISTSKISTPINFVLDIPAAGNLNVRWIHGSVSPKSTLR